MKIFLSLIFVLTLSFNNLSAQVRVAIVGGGHSSSVNEKNNVAGFDSVQKDYSGRTGVHAGFIADMPIAGSSIFYLQPGIIYFNKGRKYFSSKDTSNNNIRSISRTQYINYIDMPLNLVLKLRIGQNSKFMIGAGPYGSFFYNGKEQTQTSFKSGDFTDDLNEDLPIGNGKGKYAVFNYGLNALAGFELGRVILTAFASKGLNDFYQSTQYEGSFRHAVLGASLGICLGKQLKPEIKIKDRDKDGVPDNEDACPELAGTSLLNGCPDSDGDGIADANDKCPDMRGLAKYQGCPIPDTDSDGINDEADKCPKVAGLSKYNGCPVPDSDNDGINDEEDKCPTVAGIISNNGCPEVKKVVDKELIEKVDYAARKIQFKIYSTDLTQESTNVLKKVAEILKNNPELNLSIEGHTSSDGLPEPNMILSQKRAMAVKNYLEKQKINPVRLTAIGFGQTKPLNKGKTPEEKAKNRRVELKLNN